MQTRITEMAKYESCDTARLSARPGLLFSSVAMLDVHLPSSMGANVVYGGRYLNGINIKANIISKLEEERGGKKM